MPHSLTLFQVLHHTSKFWSSRWKPGSLQCPSLVRMTTPWLLCSEQERGSPCSFHRQLGQGTLPKLNTMENCPQIGTQRWSQLTQFGSSSFTFSSMCTYLEGGCKKWLYVSHCSFLFLENIQYSKVKFTPYFLLTSVIPWYLNSITPVICDSKKWYI